ALTPGDVLSLGQVRLRVMKVVPRRGVTPSGAAARGRSDRLARVAPRTQPMERPTAPSSSGAAPRPAATGRVTPAALARPELPPLDPPVEPRPATASLARPKAPEVDPAAEELREREARRERQLARARQLSDEMLL